MKKRFGIPTVLLALFLGVALIGSPIMVSGASGAQFQIGVQNVLDKADCLASYLRNEKQMVVPDTFVDDSGLAGTIMGMAPDGQNIPTDIQDEKLATNAALSQALSQVKGTSRQAYAQSFPSGLLSKGFSAGQFFDLLSAMEQETDNVPAGYCEPEAFEPGRTIFDLEGRFEEEPDHYKRPEPEPEEEGNFIYYGKKYKVTDTPDTPGGDVYGDVYVTGNGIISFTQPFDLSDPDGSTREDESSLSGDEVYPPTIGPLFVMPEDVGDGGDVVSPQDVMDRPTVSAEASGSFYRFAYDLSSDGDIEPAQERYLGLYGDHMSATLYVNEASDESDWIVLSYGDIWLEYADAFVGLMPGDGSAGHPGEGASRIAPNWPEGIDLSEQTGESLGFGPEYTWVYEQFYGYGGYDSVTEVERYGWFDLADSFLVFRPDGDNAYTVTTGHRSMVVDSLGLDGNRTVLDTAIENLRDPDLLALVDAGEFIPGDFNGYDWTGYEYGLQTVGQEDYGYGGQLYSFDNWNWINGDVVDRINQNGLLAYAVQLEEDVVNKKALEMVGQTALRDAAGYQAIRERDDWFMQNADAQSGRVTKDAHGNWVRSQQYVLRPDAKTVKLVNVTWRGGDAGNLAGLHTMDFTTRLDEPYDGPLTALPWNTWLDTQSVHPEGAPDYVRFVWTTETAPELSRMSVKFENPASESLQEARTFADRLTPEGAAPNQALQMIEGEQLTLATLTDSTTYDFVTGFGGDPVGLEYTVVPDTTGFDYRLGDGRSIDVAFYALGDGEHYGDLGRYGWQDDAYRYNQDYYAEYFADNVHDIWAALGVNEGEGLPYIGSNILEMSIDEGGSVFQNPIDVVYIPMSRMLWKDIAD